MTGVSLTSAMAAFLVKTAWCLGNGVIIMQILETKKNAENKIMFFCSDISTPIIKILSTLTLLFSFYRY